jgi:prolyl oligopeptidase
VFEGEVSDVWAGVSVDDTPGFERTFFLRALDFYRKKTWLQQPGGALLALDVPDDADVDFFRDTLLLQLRSDWRPAGVTYPSGALLATDAAAYLAGERNMQVVFAPTATRSLAGMSTTRDHLLLSVLDNVVGQMELWRKQGSTFIGGPVPAPGPGTLGLGALHDPHTPNDPLAEAYFLSYTDFLTPDSLALCDTARPVPALDDKAAWIKSRRPQFDARGMQVSQHHARSADGTAVPYFVVSPPQDGVATPRPTLLYGYGGFEVSLEPWYSGTQGRAWSSHGGVWVVANLRGGGEFGPAWHQAATGAGKQRCFDDFHAVAEDLIARGITTPAQLGIMGGSNGGLLVGAAFTQRPDLFGAVVCQVPLLDMKRYHLLLAGASWMAEYGDPDVAEDWAAIQRYSPYHNLHPGRRYPKVLFTTSTRDDRVHPAHARKMAARMIEQGHPLLYWENIEGGHGGAADNGQRAHLQALEFSYLWQQLGG